MNRQQVQMMDPTDTSAMQSAPPLSVSSRAIESGWRTALHRVFGRTRFSADSQAVRFIKPSPVNDIHSRLNETFVHRVLQPTCIDEISAFVRNARLENRPISIAGGRHAMGGQQFGADTILFDTGSLNRVLSFDPQKGLIEVQAGIRWPELLSYLNRVQSGQWPQWGIRQKQTGADRLSIGGALSANAHGRGLRFKPIIDDVESFTLVDANGRVKICSRQENNDLFQLAIGGYGLFGVISTVTLRLMLRRKVQRLVKVIDLQELIPSINRRIDEGCLYGDFQFAIDSESNDYLNKGVFSCYQPIADYEAMPAHQRELRSKDWMKLFYLAHEDKRRAFELYSTYYLTTHGQRYWSDSHQLSEYVDDYHLRLDKRLVSSQPGTEMISEIYVPREKLLRYMDDVRKNLRTASADVIYGTIRFIERDDESFLAWAKDNYACIVFNLHTGHTPFDLEKTATNFRGLIECAIDHGGSYYLTYHRWATRRQVEICYPQFGEFLQLKKAHDPEERFQSEWYRHYRKMFADALQSAC